MNAGLNLSLFEGTFELKANQNFFPSKKLLRYEEEKANENLHYSLTEKKDSLGDHNVLVDLKSFDSKYLSFTFRSKNEEKDYLVIKGKFKKDGFFYFDKRDFECIGFPFLLGGCFNCKTRVGIGEDKGLVINKAISHKGAILLFYMSGESYNLAYHFARVHEAS